jgi:hypothetical protein
MSRQNNTQIVFRDKIKKRYDARIESSYNRAKSAEVMKGTEGNNSLKIEENASMGYTV